MIASYNYEIHDDGYSASGGNEQVSTLFHAIKKKVATVEYKNRGRNGNYAQRKKSAICKKIGLSTKKRKDMLRRL